MAQSFIDAATTSATAGSSGSPRSMVRRRLRYTSLGSRWRIMPREKMSLPKMESTRSSVIRPPLRERAVVVTVLAASYVGGVGERRNKRGLCERRGRSQGVFEIRDIGIVKLGVHRVRQVPLAEVADDGNDELAGILPPAGNLERGPGNRAAGDARKDRFLSSKATGGGNGVVVGHLDYLVVDPG